MALNRCQEVVEEPKEIPPEPAFAQAAGGVCQCEQPMVNWVANGQWRPEKSKSRSHWSFGKVIQQSIQEVGDGFFWGGA